MLEQAASFFYTRRGEACSDCLDGINFIIMRNKIRLVAFTGYLLTSLIVSSCSDSEDPGPVQEAEEQFSIVDFDRLEMGNAFIIDVEQGDFFSISARGDRRNIEDLEVYKDGNTLVIRYDENSDRRHHTFLSITMPVLKSVNFSGATNSTVSGFSSEDQFDLYLSGASMAQVNIGSPEVNVVLSGASDLTLIGSGTELKADISGASKLNSYRFLAEDADINASGASSAKVFAASKLKATASGASTIMYQGDPQVTGNATGSSSVLKD